MRTATKEKIFIFLMIVLTLLFLKNIIVNLTHRQLSAPEDPQKQYEENSLDNYRDNDLFVDSIQPVS